MKKLLLAFLALGLVSSAAAQTSDAWNVSDTVVTPDSVYTGDAFTAENLTDFNASVSLGSNESLEAVLRGYNSTDETFNQSFDLVDGSNSNGIQSFSDNTTTFVVEFNATGGDVTVLDAAIGGDILDSSPAGVAPGSGGLLTGNFFSGIPVIGQAFETIGNAINGFISYITGAWTP